MAEWVRDAAGAAIIAIDFVVAAALLWRGRGRPMPRRLQWLRRWRWSRWLFRQTQSRARSSGRGIID